jgi:hypothetical protein
MPHPMNTRTLAVLLVAGAVCCRRSAPSPDTAAVPKAAPATPAPPPPIAAALDTSPRVGMGLPFPGSWTPTTVYQDSLFSIEYPASATIEHQPPATYYSPSYPQLVIGPLPECRWRCELRIMVHRDSTRDPLARIVAQTRAPKTRDEEGMAEGPQSLIDSMPFGPDRAVHFTNYCGDCGDYEFMTTHSPWVATIRYTLDDREGYNPALLARIAAVVRTFRWRR